MREVIRKDTPEWHARRKTLITASDVPLITGNPYGLTHMDVYERKESQQEMNHHMQRGLDAEPLLYATLGHFRPAKHRWFDSLVVNSRYPWLGATPDVISVYRGRFAVTDLKCPASYWNWDSDKYRDQVLTQCLVLGYSLGFVYSGLLRGKKGGERVEDFRLSEFRLSPLDRDRILETTHAAWQLWSTDGWKVKEW